jgi:hypothetical protein
MKNYIYMLICPIMFYSCMDKVEKREISVINKSNDIVYCLLSETDSLKVPNSYFKETFFDAYCRIKKDSLIHVANKPTNWDFFIEVKCENGKLRLFFISKELIDNYGWKVVLTKNIYTKVYRMNIDDLKKYKWKITYYGK